MSIIVFWLKTNNEPNSVEFKDTELGRALKYAELHRNQGMRHVTISSEMDNMVGKNGVDSVENGMCPDGEKYDWDKAHRGSGPRKEGT